VFRSEAHGFRTVHEELAKGMTFDLKSNEQTAVKNVLKVRLFPHASVWFNLKRKAFVYSSKVLEERKSVQNSNKQKCFDDD